MTTTLWIARDKDEILWLFEKCPTKKENQFYPANDKTGKFTYCRSMPMV